MASDPADYSDKLSFLAEWFDYAAAFGKKFVLNYFPADNTLELFDRDTNRMFLKRMACDTVLPKEVYVGNSLRIYGRQIKITDYADCKTKKIIGKARQHTFALIKPSAFDKLGEIIDQIQDREFQIMKIRLTHMTQIEALEFYEAKKGEHFLPFVVEHVASGPSISLDLVGDDAIERWKKIVGPTDPYEARKTAPESLRAIYGQEKASNAFHAAEDCDAVVKAVHYFFPEDGTVKRGPPFKPRLINTTCCIVKPHAVHEGKLGCIITSITESRFKITSMQTFYLSNANAEEFLEVYKGVISDYHALMMSLLDGPCVVMEIAGKFDNQEDVHGEFRKFVGPGDSEIARQIRPNTLRARYGVDKYRNAVHCTDLPEDTELELEYFFKILC